MLFCLTLIGAAGIIFGSQSLIVRQLESLRVLPRSQNFTELYFAADAQLPAATKIGRVQKLIFTAHNSEHATTTYRYKLSAIKGSDGTAHPLSNGTILLSHDQTRTINETVTIPPVDASRIALRIELVYEGVAFGANTRSEQRQSIQHWMNIVGLQT